MLCKLTKIACKFDFLLTGKKERKYFHKCLEFLFVILLQYLDKLKINFRFCKLTPSWTQEAFFNKVFFTRN